ncbi:MAG: hypothetical protein HQL78_04855 [Magnetococcales bacterium]|nr:hypothetical protein [Magnetococcales bacterium]
MTHSREKLGLAGSFLLLLLLGCTAIPTHSLAQPTPQGTGIPVLVMGEDADPKTISRSSNIFKRVLGELKANMGRQGFRMVDEEMLAVAGRWKIQERRPKTELIDVSRLANAAGDSRFNHRAMVLFSVFASKRNQGYANEIQTRIEGEIYDAKTYQFIDRFELPTAVYPGPAECNDVCISETVGNKASEIAMSLGDILGKKLAFLQPQSNNSVTPTVGMTVAKGRDEPVERYQPSASHTMMTTYGVTFRHFDVAEILSIVGVMSGEFPGYSSHNVIEQGPAVQKYEYLSTATVAKMVEWLNILLLDMGLHPDRNVVILVEGTQITLDKITPSPQPSGNRQVPRFR